MTSSFTDLSCSRMEVDSYQDGSLTVKLSFKCRFFLTIDDGNNKIKLTDEQQLLEALKTSKPGSFLSFGEEVLETKTTKKGVIVRNTTIAPKYRRTSVKITHDKIPALISYLEEIDVIKRSIKIQ